MKKFLLPILVILILGSSSPVSANNFSMLRENATTDIAIDTLPDGHSLYELSSYEMELFSNPSTRSQITGCHCDIELSLNERFYILGKMVTFVMPSAKSLTGLNRAATASAGTSDDVGRSLIQLKNSAPQGGESFGFLIQEGKIALSGRAVSHGKMDFVVLKNGELNLGFGHYNLSNGAQEVLAAGKIKLYNGQVTQISNWSGHYQPSTSLAESFSEILRQIGVKVSGAKLQLYNQKGVLVKSIRVP